MIFRNKMRKVAALMAAVMVVSAAPLEVYAQEDTIDIEQEVLFDASGDAIVFSASGDAAEEIAYEAEEVGADALASGDASASGDATEFTYETVDLDLNREPILFSTLISSKVTALKNGLVKEGDVSYYYKNNVKQSGWITIDNKKYYFDPTSYAMSVGEKKIGGKWYYFNSAGQMQTGFVNLASSGKTVYYGSDGQMQYGQIKIGGYWYYFKEGTGAMITGFYRIPAMNKTVYYDSKGHMLYGQQKIGGYWYYFTEGSGAMKTGLVYIAAQKKYVYYNSQGRMQYGQVKIGNYWYYFTEGSGAMKTGLVYISAQKKHVYYNSNGRMQYGQIKIGNYWYYFAEGSGAMVKGWKYISAQGKWAYYNARGRMVKGYHKISGVYYYFNLKTGAYVGQADTSKVLIAQASIDEKGGISGGKAGDQTWQETNVNPYYTSSWTYVFRAVNAAVAEKIAYAMEQAGMNENIGYDQNQRNTLYVQMAKQGTYDPAKLSTPVEADCSSMLSAALRYAGFSHSQVTVSYGNNYNCLYTGNVKDKIEETKAFKTLSASAVPVSSLKRGDIILKNGHVAVVVKAVGE